MNKDYFRYYHPKGLVLTIIILSVIIGLMAKMFYPYLNSLISEPYLQFPTVSVLIIGVFSIFNKHGLKLPIVKKMFWSRDISGRYEGSISYKHFKTKIVTEKPCVLEIEQDASRINVKTYFKFDKDRSEKTKSTSLVSSLVLDEFDNLSLIYTYHNSGNTIENISPSNGTNILSITGNDDKIQLEGVYYTDRIPQTKGNLKVIFKSKKLKKQF